MSKANSIIRGGLSGPFIAICIIMINIISFGYLFAANGTSAAAEIPISLQIKIFLKIVTYDRSFDKTATDSYHIGIVMRDDGDTDCERAFKQVADALAGKTIFGRSLAPVKLVMNNGKLPRQEADPEILVLIGDWSRDSSDIAEYAKAHRLVTFGSSRELLNSGIVVVMTLDGNRPVINLNLNEARAVGADFHANFLKHCRVIR